MDKKTKELLAANAVRESILNTDILHPNISENDKTMSWDGFIEVYKTPNKESKANLSGRVPVQVKGTENNNHTKSITFSAETSDLRNYLHDKGAIYFVVRIHKDDPSRKTIYCETLTPVKIEQYLKGAEKKKTKTIDLKEFPSTKAEKTEIVVNFLNACTRQLSHVDTGFIPLDDIRDGKYNYRIPYTGFGERAKDPISCVLGKEMYAYAIIPNHDTLVPADTPLTINSAHRRVNGDIRVSNKCYYTDFEYMVSTDGTSIKIGDSLTLSFKQSDDISGNTLVECKITVPLSARAAARDIPFVIDMLRAGSLSINTIPLNLNSSDTFPSDFIKDMEDRLSQCKAISELLDVLNVAEDLDIGGLTKKEARHIDTLIDAFVNKKNIDVIEDSTVTAVWDLKISNINLKLIVINNNDGTHTIQDFFDSPVEVSYKQSGGERFISSPYSVLQKADYKVVSNICYDKILDSFRERLPKNPRIFKRANIDMLQMLLAYDETANPKCFAAVKSMSEWMLKEAYDDILGYNLRLLNYLQVIKRERSLNDNEIYKLYRITESGDVEEFEKVGAYLLLDQQKAAKLHFNKLTKKEQKEFMTYPIAKFCSFA